MSILYFLIFFILFIIGTLNLFSYLRLSPMQANLFKETSLKERSFSKKLLEKRENYILSTFILLVVLLSFSLYFLFSIRGFVELNSFVKILIALFFSIIVFILLGFLSLNYSMTLFKATFFTLRILILFFYPFSIISSLLAGEKKDEDETEENREEEIEAFIDEGQREGIIEDEERELIKGVMEFKDTMVREIMTPRIDIVSIESERSVKDALILFAEKRHTRMPIYEGTIDNIIGVVFIKDLLPAIVNGEENKKIKEFSNPISFVPENKAILDLLREMQKEKEQIVIVVDEYGGVDGLVTLEDLVEEIVGEIEEREESSLIKVLGERLYEINGRVSLKDISEISGFNFEEGDYDSVAGFIATKIGTIPQTGERFKIDGIDVEILFSDKKRIHKVKLAFPEGGKNEKSDM